MLTPDEIREALHMANLLATERNRAIEEVTGVLPSLCPECSGEMKSGRGEISCDCGFTIYDDAPRLESE